MNFAEFQRSIAGSEPPEGLTPPLLALWWVRKNEWEKAHAIVMAAAGKDCAWVHAHLHRIEGDAGNARYWYGQARRAPCDEPLSVEWETIARSLLGAR